MGYSERDLYNEDIVRHYDDNNNDHGGCFLTTACVEYKGLADDCYELNTLRNFRDSYMLSFKEGRKDVQTYYEIAPNIVKEINKLDNKDEVYNYIYENLIVECINLINMNSMNESYEKYKEVVKQLYNKYCLNI